MPVRAPFEHSASKAVLVAFLTLIAVSVISFLSGLIAGALKLPRLPADLVAPFNLVVPVLAGAWWFRSKVRRPMSHQERLAFAAGVTLMDAILAVGIAYFLVRTGLPASPIGFLPLVVVLLLIFTGAYFLAWLLTSGRRATPTT